MIVLFKLVHPQVVQSRSNDNPWDGGGGGGGVRAGPSRNNNKRAKPYDKDKQPRAKRKCGNCGQEGNYIVFVVIQSQTTSL